MELLEKSRTIESRLYNDWKLCKVYIESKSDRITKLLKQLIMSLNITKPKWLKTALDQSITHDLCYYGMTMFQIKMNAVTDFYAN
ncbi:hypothetical protein DCO56_02695 [Sphingobacterium athyrii]|uniref:Uncharacterized protein n=1 Tax=Sphingobacterium athyrii TaxID=2152717 RepID=A0A363NYU2_9SPHI|nr:hypothetical protein DCO56_02695 [Sphingobacterium athyrii]